MRPNSSCCKRERNGLSAADAYESDCQRCIQYGECTSYCEASWCLERCRTGIAKTHLEHDKATLLESVGEEAVVMAS